MNTDMRPMANPTPSAGELDMLRAAVRDMMASLYPSAPDERWPSTWHWETLASQGLWSSIEAPDGSLAAASVVMEELGRALYPGPACEALTAACLVSRFDDLEVAEAHGTPPAAFVNSEAPSVRVAPTTALLVAHGEGLVVALTSDVGCAGSPTSDVSRDIVWVGTPSQRTSLRYQHAAQYGRAVRAVLYCADTLGCVEYVLERAVEYAGQRTTFGAPIGKYQAVAHRLVDHAVTVRQMRLLLDSAAAAVDASQPDLAHRVAVAETYFHAHACELVSDCIQLAGAIGFTWEFGHHFYLRRLVSNGALAGGGGRPAQRLLKEVMW